jgi:drug/metabolite transporter (DMT)-like permease
MSAGVVIALAVTAAIGWGAGDFFGGDSTGRDISVFAVICLSELIGAIVMVPLLLVRGHGAPHTDPVIEATVAGLGMTCGLSLIYTALSRGLAFITAPVGAVGAALAATVGVISGDPLSVLIAFGLLCAIGGSALSSLPSRAGSIATPGRSEIAMALGAAIAFATTLSTVHAASRADPYWATAIEHTSSGLWAGAVVLISVVRRRRGAVTGAGADASGGAGAGARGGISPRQLATFGLIALLGTGGDLAYNAASHGGSLTIVAAIASLYPVTTILLGGLLKHQRASTVQLLGVGLALAGTVLLGVATS